MNTWLELGGALYVEWLAIEKSVARVRFEEMDSGGDGESSASEAELSGIVNNWSEEEEGEMSGDETRRMVTQQNRKGKKSGGFQSMGTHTHTHTISQNMQLYRAPLIAMTPCNSLCRAESSCIHWYNAQGVQSSNTYSKEGMSAVESKYGTGL